jgi:hypothetical protein
MKPPKFPDTLPDSARFDQLAPPPPCFQPLRYRDLWDHWRGRVGGQPQTPAR